MPEKCKKKKKIVGYGGVFGALLTDLSKAFDCVPHDHFIAKLEAYDFQTDALKIVYDYLPKRKQRVNINETFTFWKDIKHRVPQRSVVGPLLFIIHLCDLFYFLEDLDIANYADYTTICTVKKNKESVINFLEASLLSLFNCSITTILKLTVARVTSFLSCREPSRALLNGSSIESNVKEILLKVTNDRVLGLDDHVNNLASE